MLGVESVLAATLPSWLFVLMVHMNPMALDAERPSMRCSSMIGDGRVLLALAPMQDVTDLAFMRLIAEYGAPDLYFTEYFRVHSASRPDRHILRSITENSTERPVIAQLMGNDPEALARTARELQEYPIGGIDLNLGCPAPTVYRKCAGGGLLRDLPRVDSILGALRDAVRVPFSVKTRLGFDGRADFASLLQIFRRHAPDLVTVHGRTVTGGYTAAVDHESIAEAAATMQCPVLANGNVSSVADALDVLRKTGVRGLMIGRGAIRNPWLFAQIHSALQGGPAFSPSARDLLAYLHRLYDAVSPPDVPESVLVRKMKKYICFIGVGLEQSEAFLYRMRRVESRAEFDAVAQDFLAHDGPAFLTAE